ncbi:hypothetical protein KNO15_09790 [Leifsonia shinshuensis]|uniref:hypothetical protein n=1 Tax=Leifsonia shinshuensis TaxID=150026 RepID=UPI001F50592C|nr:hypothetical protein [Leifsonia shinshuensis]MCI0156984.1 hypothetical protein [Leifsonia shinshuensis]
MKLIIFVAGVAVGFVIGSRAGRGAYENIRNKWQGFSDSDPVQKVKGDVRDLAGRAASDLGDKVSEAVGKASDKLDEVTGKSAGTAPTEA